MELQKNTVEVVENVKNQLMKSMHELENNKTWDDKLHISVQNDLAHSDKISTSKLYITNTI